MSTPPDNASPTPTGGWLELAVAADQEAAEAISELLAQYGYNGGVTVEAVPPDDARADEPGVPLPMTSDPRYPVTLRTYLPLDNQTEATRQRIEQALWHLGQLRPVGQLQTRTIAEEDWAHTWKRYYGIQRIGQRTVIVPSWLDYRPQPADVVLHLDPGMAFGTGLHPTTQLCVQLLEAYARPGITMLDMGTGSGILAIAAALQGVAPILALDNDPVAVTAARANVAHNGLTATITVDLAPPATPLPAPFAACDVICANIIASVLVELAPQLRAWLRPGGILISSGIILDREIEVSLAYAAAGLQPIARHVAGEWVALVSRAPAAPTA